MNAGCDDAKTEAHVKYTFPYLHSCLASRHSFAYVNGSMPDYGQQPQCAVPSLSASKAVALYLSQSPLQHVAPAATGLQQAAPARTCVCCSAVCRFSALADHVAYSASAPPAGQALACITCKGKHDCGVDNDEKFLYVCAECTRLSHEALVEAKTCFNGVFHMDKSVHLKDIVSYYLFLSKIHPTIARAYYIFPSQIGFNTQIYAGTAASVDYIEALSIVERSYHPAMASSTMPTTSTPTAIIYTAFHSFFITQKGLQIMMAVRGALDAASAEARTTKAAARTVAVPLPAAVEDRKRARDEANYTSRYADSVLRGTEARRVALTLAIEKVRTALRLRPG